MSKIVEGIAKDLKSIPEKLKAKTGNVDKKKLFLMNLPYALAGYFCDKIAWLWRGGPGGGGFPQHVVPQRRWRSWRGWRTYFPTRYQVSTQKIC